MFTFLNVGKWYLHGSNIVFNKFIVCMDVLFDKFLVDAFQFRQNPIEPAKLTQKKAAFDF